jgi:hypothetical protein
MINSRLTGRFAASAGEDVMTAVSRAAKLKRSV